MKNFHFFSGCRIRTSTIFHILLVGLFVITLASEIRYAAIPVIDGFSSLRLIGLSYQKRLELHEDPLVKALDNVLYAQYAQNKGICFVELPYDKLAEEGLGSNYPPGGEFGHLICKADYNLYPVSIDWGYSRGNQLYRIVFSYNILFGSKPIASLDHYPCVIRIIPHGNMVAIQRIKGAPDAP